MAMAERVTVEQYLHMSFEHDAEFVEGRIVGRPLPTCEHSDLRGFLIEILRPMGRRLGFHAVPEQRVRVRPDRCRIPDVCLVFEKPAGQIVTTPPYLCIEISCRRKTGTSKRSKRSMNMSGSECRGFG